MEGWSVAANVVDCSRLLTALSQVAAMAGLTFLCLKSLARLLEGQALKLDLNRGGEAEKKIVQMKRLGDRECTPF